MREYWVNVYKYGGIPVLIGVARSTREASNDLARLCANLRPLYRIHVKLKEGV